MRIGRLLLLLAVFAILWSARANAEVTPESLLAKCAATREMFKSVAIQGTTVQTYSDTKMTGDRWAREDVSYLADRDRFDATMNLWFLDSADQDVSRAADRTQQMLWDGKTWYEMTETSPTDMEQWTAYIRAKESDARAYLHTGLLSAPMWGRFPGDNGPIEEIVSRASTVKLRPGVEKIGESECYVIEIKGASGSHTLWIDPQHGYDIRRAQSVKAGKDLWYGQAVDEKMKDEFGEMRDNVPTPPSSGRASCSFEYEVAEYIQVGGAWIPRAANWKTDILHDDGRRLTSQVQHERKQVVVNPDFASMDRAFKPRFRNGTRIYREGDSRVIPMYWLDGKVEANVNREIIDMLDKSVDSLSARDVASGMPSSSTSRPEQADPRLPKPGRIEPEQAVASGPNLWLVWGGVTAGLAVLCALVVGVRHRKKARVR